MTRKHEINNNGTANVKTAMWTETFQSYPHRKQPADQGWIMGAVEMRKRGRTAMNLDEGAAREQQGAVSTCQSPSGDAASVGTSGVL